MTMHRLQYGVLLILALQALSGCGGGGSSSAPAQAVAPPPAVAPPAGATVGLAARPDNASCVAPARPLTATSLALTDAFPDLPDLPAPMKLVQAAGEPGQWYAVLREGGLQRFADRADVASSERYLDLTVTASGEGGFLAAALDPDWPATRELYVSYTVEDGGFESRLSRLVITDDSSLPARFTEEILLRVAQPFSNHNGGDLGFGPDGALYWSLGDGGSGGDPFDYSQNTRRLLGSVLRLNVRGIAFPSPGYRIPAGNPFAGNAQCGPEDNAADCPEIYAYGLRNPWRMSFDSDTGALYVGDVGQGAREEINLIEQGGNYGWRCREGTQPFDDTGCAGKTFVEPIHDYDRSAGDRSVTGGYVYRGTAVPDLVGRYLFGDFVSGRVWSLTRNGTGYERAELADLDTNVAGFSQGRDGEVYVLTIAEGRILRFSADGGIRQDSVPDDLSQTGCFDAADPAIPSPGALPYQPNAPFWADGADKARWLALPNGAQIDTADNRAWTYPTGSVFLKHFRLSGQLVETRLFMRHPDGAWAGYSYEWDDAEQGATRVRGGKVRDVGGTQWIYPSESECLDCHTEAAGFVLGAEAAQLNGDLTYPSTGTTANQLETLSGIGFLRPALGVDADTLAALADPADGSASLTDRARAYLHVNCASCHQPGGPTGADLDLRYDTALNATGSCDAVPQNGDLGIANARVVAPGAPDRSTLLARMNRRDADAMPPIGSSQVDTDGVALIRDWISGLGGCP
jgi:uncharacterized repeat protein (TIGR03806 family)